MKGVTETKSLDFETGLWSRKCLFLWLLSPSQGTEVQSNWCHSNKRLHSRFAHQAKLNLNRVVEIKQQIQGTYQVNVPGLIKTEEGFLLFIISQPNQVLCLPSFDDVEKISKVMGGCFCYRKLKTLWNKMMQHHPHTQFFGFSNARTVYQQRQ